MSKVNKNTISPHRAGDDTYRRIPETESSRKLSSSLVKYIKSLEMKKYRSRDNVFVAEGPKVVGDLMQFSEPRRVIATAEWFEKTGRKLREGDVKVSAEELKKASFLLHPQQVLALFDIPYDSVDVDICQRELCLALDRVQDPGNMGTIIRIADWFGISTIFCGNDTVDAYCPKVVQATMGSIARVRLVYTDIVSLLDKLPSSVPVYATSLSGDNIYTQPLSDTGIIVMGNEGRGVSEEVMKRINRTLYIPSYCKDNHAESLNVAIATAITCAEFRRRG
ncbi:MAG: RNA methyltransferase [Prevotella sp.]